VPAFDLGGWNGIGEDVVTGACSCLRHHLTGDGDALAGLAGDTNDEILTSHVFKAASCTIGAQRLGRGSGGPSNCGWNGSRPTHPSATLPSGAMVETTLCSSRRIIARC